MRNFGQLLVEQATVTDATSAQSLDLRSFWSPQATEASGCFIHDCPRKDDSMSCPLVLVFFVFMLPFVVSDSSMDQI